MEDKDVYPSTSTASSEIEVDPPVRDNDFSDYYWMMEEEAFESKYNQQLEMEEQMEECLKMIEQDECAKQEASSCNSSNEGNSTLIARNREKSMSSDCPNKCGTKKVEVGQDDKEKKEQEKMEKDVEKKERKQLDPNAKEFVPSRRDSGSPVKASTSKC